MPTQAAEAVTELGEARTLPRADPANVRALNRLHAAAPLHGVVAKGASYRLAWHHDAAFGHTARESYSFRLGAHVGHLAMDAPSMQALLGERRIDLLPRDLRYILLADALHPVIDALEKALRLHFEWQPSEAEARAPRDARETREQPLLHCDPERAAFFVATPSDGGAMLRGFVQFDDAATLDALVPAATGAAHAVRTSEAFDALHLPVSFGLGSTPIQLREIRSIRPGDIVGIEQWSSSGGGIVVTAELGGPTGLHLSAVAEGSRITVQQSRDSAMKPDTPADPAATADNNVNLPIDRLDALEVTLRFEVGDLSLSLGELKSIRAGHVFDLAEPLNRSPVRILAHGNVLGKGYLVAVGDRLGVRVSEFAPGEV